MMKPCPTCPSPAACKKAGICAKTGKRLTMEPRDSGMKMDPQYKSSGGTIFKGR